MTREVEHPEEATRTSSPITPPLRRRWPRTILLAVAALAAVVVATRMLTAPVPQASAPAMAPPKVVVATPLRQRLATWTSFTGQFSAVDRVEIRAEVSGYLTEIHFTDGQLVKKGDLLFVIDPRPYDIALQNARAQVATAEAALKLSGQQLERTSNLVTSSFASRETLDQRTEQRQAADAALDQAKAAVRKAELDLGWTHIAAPLSGRIGRHLVSTGNLIAGGQGGGATTLLTTIVSEDPIYLDFDMGESDFVAYQRFLHRPHDGRRHRPNRRCRAVGRERLEAPRHARLPRQRDGSLVGHAARPGHRAQPRPLHRRRPVRPPAGTDRRAGRHAAGTGGRARHRPVAHDGDGRGARRDRRAEGGRHRRAGRRPPHRQARPWRPRIASSSTA